MDAMLTAMPIFSALPASVFPVSQRRLSCQSLKRHASQVPKSCLQGNASPACLEDTCPSFPWSQSERSQRTKSGLRVFGFCPAGSTSKQLPSDQFEGCLVGFVQDGQIIHS